MSRLVLPIHDLARRHSGLTPAVGEYYTEGARVCLDRHHKSPREFEIGRAKTKSKVVAEWRKTDERTRRAWANEIDTTEAGACALSLAGVEVLEGLVAVHRAETETGADYYVAPAGTSPGDLEDCSRLEISGVDRGSLTDVTYRLKKKLRQAAAGVSNLPALAGIVGFRVRVILFAHLGEEK